MFSVPSYPGENLGKVCENSRAGEDPQLRVGFKFLWPAFYFLTITLSFTEYSLLFIAEEEHVFLDLDVKLSKYAPVKWKEEVMSLFHFLS